jgi:hypothetical protein
LENEREAVMTDAQTKVAGAREGSDMSRDVAIAGGTTVIDGSTLFDGLPRLFNRPDRSLALVHILGLKKPCWRCDATSTPLVAMLEESRDPFSEDLVLCDDDVILAFAWDRLPAEARFEHCVGEVKIRSSKTTGTSYLSNGCSACGAIFGNFPLFHENLPEALSEGFDTLTVLATVRIPFREYNEIYESRWS